jgi:two-component system, NtrC family, response regulator PilR
MHKILVVDDDAGGLRNVACFLRLEEYDVDEACDGNQAVLLLDQVKFDLVLSDVMMPGLNGLDLLEHIRSAAPDIPVLLMSGFSHIELDEIIKRGAVDFIIKPLDLDVLLSKVRRALDPKSLE